MIAKLAHISKNALLVLLALQVLNLSTNTIDFQPFHTSNLYEFNDLNSITEYVAEIVLNHDNAFPEFGLQSSAPKSQAEKHVSLKLSVVPKPFTVLQKKEEVPVRYSDAINDTYRYLFFEEINPPPPKC